MRNFQIIVAHAVTLNSYGKAASASFTTRLTDFVRKSFTHFIKKFRNIWIFFHIFMRWTAGMLLCKKSKLVLARNMRFFDDAIHQNRKIIHCLCRQIPVSPEEKFISTLFHRSYVISNGHRHKKGSHLLRTFCYHTPYVTVWTFFGTFYVDQPYGIRGNFSGAVQRMNNEWRRLYQPNHAF